MASSLTVAASTINGYEYCLLQTTLTAHDPHANANAHAHAHAHAHVLILQT